MLPKDFPPFTTVQGYFYQWRDTGLFERINFELMLQAREVAGREPSPSAGVIAIPTDTRGRAIPHCAPRLARYISPLDVLDPERCHRLSMSRPSRLPRRLQANKTKSPRRTVVTSVVQDLACRAHCGYALYRTSTRSSARKINYYRCLSSDAWRRLGGPICHNRQVRQDRLDAVVWTEILKLLEDPNLIQNELDRLLEATRHADSTKCRQATLHRYLSRLQKSIERLLTAYQEDLLSLDELRHRMPDLRRRTQSVPSCNRLQTRRPTALLIRVSPKH
jgi:hypothetical protein